MGFEYKELRELENKLKLLSDKKSINNFFDECVKELALRFLADAIRKTPVADPKKYKVARRIKKDGHYVRYKRDTKNNKAGDFKTKIVNTYANGTGGTLRRGWVCKTQQEAESNKALPNAKEIEQFLKNIKVIRNGKRYLIKLINPVEYAIYVNYGHRTRNGGYVDGRFFLEKAENFINSNKDKYLQKKLKEYIGSVFND